MGYNFLTSLSAYHCILTELSDKQRAVYVCLCEYGPMTNQELSTRLGWQINCITPRTGELVEKCLARPCGLKKCPSGRMGTVWQPLIGNKASEYQEVMF